MLLHIMSQYLCIFSLILQGLHEEGECRQLEFGAGKGANIRDLFRTTPKVMKLHESQFWNILKILGEESTKGGPPTVHEGGGRAQPLWACPLPRGPPGSPLMPIFWYMVSFALKKIIRKLLGQSAAISRWNLGRTNLGLWRSCSAGETSLQEGEIIAIVITIDTLIKRRSISINIFTSTISSPNPSSYLVSNSYLQVRDWS